MKAYRLSINLKLGLVLFAVVIAVASLLYTNRLVSRLREREQFVIQLWAIAREQLAQSTQSGNPYVAELRAMDRLLQELPAGTGAAALTPERLQAFRRALGWAQTMPTSADVTLAGEILRMGNFGIPAIIVDSTLGQPVAWQNVAVPDSLQGRPATDLAAAEQRLLQRAAAMADVYPPIPIEMDFGDQKLEQYIFYDESRLVKELRLFPYVQLLCVGLFILAGYLGFSYVRRSEQRSLWVGMAKEAAHQLGTPISSLMGWHELLRLPELAPDQQQAALDEVENDIQRLQRVANRFSDIGSLPKLQPTSLAPVIGATADYMRRRIPQQGKRVTLEVSVPPDLQVPLNAELFEWVVENLLKNALDALEANEGRIEITARWHEGQALIDVHDTGKGIDRRQWKNIFRPGYSTKKRGWGLGLSLAKRIVEDYHGGQLTLAQSRPGHGTTFRIELPGVVRGRAAMRRADRQPTV